MCVTNLDVCSVYLQGGGSISQSKAIVFHLDVSKTSVAIVTSDRGIQVDGLAVPLYGFLVPPRWGNETRTSRMGILGTKTGECKQREIWNENSSHIIQCDAWLSVLGI